MVKSKHRFPIHLFTDAAPTDMVFVTSSGKQRKTGKGISVWVGPQTSILIIPTTVQKRSLQFTLVSSDNQDFTVSGEVQFRFVPDLAKDQYDFSVDVNDGVPLTTAVADAGDLAVAKLRPSFLGFGADKNIKALNAAKHTLELSMNKLVQGLDQSNWPIAITGVSVFTAAPAANIAQALQAKAREELLADADKATAERQKAGEANRRELQLMSVETQLAYEQARVTAIDAKIANDAKEADAQAANSTKALDVYKGMSPMMVLAHAIRDGASVNTLNLSPEFLALLKEQTA